MKITWTGKGIFKADGETYKAGEAIPANVLTDIRISELKKMKLIKVEGDAPKVETLCTPEEYQKQIFEPLPEAEPIPVIEKPKTSRPRKTAGPVEEVD